MPFPDYLTSEGFETFFEPTRIWLFGKPFAGLDFNPGSMREEFTPYKVPPAGDDDLPIPPRRIERMLRRGGKTSKPIFARIYSFSFEGHYYNLPRPLLFLVYGAGDPIDPNPKPVAPPPSDPVAARVAAAEAKAAAAEATLAEYEAGGPAAKTAAAAKNETAARARDNSRRRRGPIPPQEPNPQSGHVKFNTKFTGLDARSWYFSDDILVWSVDRRDMGLCMDVEIANYQDLLLAPMAAVSRGPGSRSDMISRSDMVSRSDMTSRSDVTSRGGGSFRSDMVGPHQNF